MCQPDEALQHLGVVSVLQFQHFGGNVLHRVRCGELNLSLEHNVPLVIVLVDQVNSHA